MKRKVIQIADKTLVVSLPNSWAKEWGVVKGNELDVSESGSSLIVRTGEHRDLRKGKIDVSSSSERSLRWLLSSLHKKGYDEIEILCTVEQSKIIDELLKDLFLGFAVVHRSGNLCVIRSLSKELDDQLDVIVRRAFLVTLSLAEQCAIACKNKKFDDLKSIVDLEKTNNQLTNFCERLLNKRGMADPLKTNFLYVVVWNLEKVADDYKYICNHLAKSQKISASSLNLLDRINVLLRKYYELFYKFDAELLSVLSDEFKLLRVDIEKLMVKDDPVLLAHFLHLVLKCADFSSSTFALND